MEAKNSSGGSDRDRAAKIDDVDVMELNNGSNKNIVIRFVEYAYKVINEDMDDFFEDNMDVFDQDDEDIDSGRGETFEQYNVFQKYLEQVEVKFDQFSSVEGFDSARDCLNEINALVQKDEADRKKMMKDLQNQLRKAQQMWNKRCQLASSSVVEEGSNQISDAADAKAESKTATEGGSKHHGDSKELARADGKATAAAAAADEEDIDDELGDAMELPVMMFFQPMSMDTMLDQVLTLSEYSTFSVIMRAKLKQKKLHRLMRKKVAHQQERARERRQALGFHQDIATAAAASDIHPKDSTESLKYHSDDHVPLRLLDAEFATLVDRICELTPNQKALAEETREMLKISAWRQLVHGEAEEGAKGTGAALPLEDRKVMFQKLVMATAVTLFRLASFDQQTIIRNHINIMMPRIGTLNESMANVTTLLHRAEALFLCTSHELVDDIERQIFNVLEEFEKQHELRRQNQVHHRVEHK